MLHVTFSHHRRLPGTRTGVQHDVSVQIKPKTLGVAEGVLHQRPPPRWATPQAEATEHEEQALEGVGFT